MAKKNFRVEEIECGDDRGLFMAFELREVSDDEKKYRVEDEHFVWQPIGTFATRAEAEAAAKPSR